MAISTSDQLPLIDVVDAVSVDDVVNAIVVARSQQSAIYPLGGGSALDFGLPAKKEGVGLSLSNLDKVVDYPARDMTITAQAGMTLKAVRQTLAEHHQRLPIDVPHENTATLGGVVATNFSGARRFGAGTMRDYLIGIKAVNGKGEAFAGGGRVVKNVAGYDFCKLMTGSLGTLGVITELTLKVVPTPPITQLVACAPKSLNHVDELLERFSTSPVAPSAIEWVVGPEWNDTPVLGAWHKQNSGEIGTLLIGLEGTEPEVSKMAEQLDSEWHDASVKQVIHWSGDDADRIWKSLADFPAHQEAPLVLKVSVVPSQTVNVVQAAWEMDASCSIQAHAWQWDCHCSLGRVSSRGACQDVDGWFGASGGRGSWQRRGAVESGRRGANVAERLGWD